jgi:hypothetical protein
MSSAALSTPVPSAKITLAGRTLREEMDARRAAGKSFAVREALGLLVPVCSQLADLQKTGEKVFVHPSSLDYGAAGTELALELARTMPTEPRDRACLAPEVRKAAAGDAGDAHASVFSIGAMLYELLTGASVGPGMKRPSEAVPNLPPHVEVILGKCLLADATQRPADLGALAQALYSVAPNASLPPPALDHENHDFEIDVSMSIVPGELSVQDFVSAVSAAPAGPAPVVGDPTAQLAGLKARLEADTSPRYVVVKEGMDHGPFSAVELLQQIATGSFLATHILRDSESPGIEKPIETWPDFQPFAHQAKLNRDIKQEKRNLEAVVVAEAKGTQMKTLIGIGVVGLIVAAGAGIWMRERSNTDKELAVERDGAVAVDGVQGLGKDDPKKPGGGVGGPRPGGGGNLPQVAGGGSCEAAINSYNEQYTIGGGQGKPDLTAGQYGAVLNKGSYLNSCGVPSNMAVNICAAVQNGRAVGVSVSTNPSNPGIASCISGAVRGLSFPANPRMDVARTTFAAQ